MKAVVFYEIKEGKSRADVMAIYPRHKAWLDDFAFRKSVIGIGPFTDGSGSLGIFRDRPSAEAFVKGDPFVVEGLVRHWTIREWGDELL